VVLEDGDAVRAEAGAEGLRFLLITGAPLRKPVARHGPFVMNTRAEVEQALFDLRTGAFAWSSPVEQAADESDPLPGNGHSGGWKHSSGSRGWAFADSSHRLHIYWVG
jgi:hypothetical protein